MAYHYGKATGHYSNLMLPYNIRDFLLTIDKNSLYQKRREFSLLIKKGLFLSHTNFLILISLV